jgi:hypothetical protein
MVDLLFPTDEWADLNRYVDCDKSSESAKKLMQNGLSLNVS